METSRFFVTNLPNTVKERDLSKLFQDYGEVVRVELKTKENVVAEEQENEIKVIAFVTLRINADDVQYCINELNWQKVQGAQIKVTVAKESFLDRLKREREEAQAGTTSDNKSNDNTANETSTSELLTRNLTNTRKTFSEYVDLNEDDIAPELLITKKRAASSMHNGKIHIQSNDAAPIHVIEAKKASSASNKKLDTKALNAQQKHKNALKQMKSQYQEKKSAIQQALAGLDAPVGKKIKFSDSEDEEQKEETSVKHQTNIFGSDSEAEGDDTNELKLKPEYFGKKGEKLLQMQSKQSLDPRFKIDAKFVDEDDDEDADENAQDNENGLTIEGDTENERNWQMGILEQVVGTKIDTRNAAQKAAKNKKMLRYDPAKEEDKKFLRAPKEETEVKPKPSAAASLESKQKNKKKKQTSDLQEETENSVDNATITNNVSKEVFYVVTDTLAQSLKTRGDGFSLLNMFAQSQTLEQREDQLKKCANEKILVNKLDKTSNLNPFSYDTSSESDNDDEQTNEKQSDKQKQQAANKKSKVKISMETFFIGKNDVRLKEGAQFFKYTKKADAEENYDEVRKRLNLLIKTKISKTKKSIAARSGRVGAVATNSKRGKGRNKRF